MRIFILVSLLCVFSSAVFAENERQEPKLEIVAKLDQRPGNIAVTMNGQIFVTVHPFDTPQIKLLRVNGDGTTQIFPSERWNQKIDRTGIGFVKLLGIRATPNGSLLVLDMGDENHTPRLIEFDLRSGQTAMVNYIPMEYTNEQSFLQDFAFDWEKNHVFIADMGQVHLDKGAQPGIIFMNRTTGWMNRRLEGFEGIMPPEKPLSVGGKNITLSLNGKVYPVRAALNSITIDPITDSLYFSPMGEGNLYRAPLSKIVDPAVSDEEILQRVEIIEGKPASDGITVDSAGHVYIAAIDRGEIGVMTAEDGYKTYIKDERLQWADGFSFAPDGYLYVTISQLHRHPVFNGGVDASEKPYLIARFKPIADGAIGR